MIFTGTAVAYGIGLVAVAIGLTGCEPEVKPREYMPGIIVAGIEDCIEKQGGAKYCMDDVSPRIIKMLIQRNPELDEDQLNEWATDDFNN